MHGQVVTLGISEMGLRRGHIEGTDFAFFVNNSVIDGLHSSVVVVSLIDELGQFLQVFLLDVDQFSRDEPVHALRAGRSGQ